MPPPQICSASATQLESQCGIPRCGQTTVSSQQNGSISHTASQQSSSLQKRPWLAGKAKGSWHSKQSPVLGTPHAGSWQGSSPRTQLTPTPEKTPPKTTHCDS